MRRFGGLAGLACALVFLVSCGGGEPASTAALQPAPARAALRAAVSPQAIALDNTAVFTWAQWHYPQYFSGGYDAGVQLGYSYRYYPTTGHYLGIKDAQVYVLGPVSNNQILAVGSMASFECQVLPANCPVTTPAATPGVSLAGLYSDANGLMLISPDGAFMGYNPKFNNAGTQTQADFYTGTAAIGATSWSATSATFGTLLPGATSATRGSANITASYTSGSWQTATFTVTGTTPASTRLAMEYYGQSRSAASLWTASGIYRTPTAGQAIAIDAATGAVTGNFVTGCTINGVLTVPDANRNIYKMTAILAGANCPVQGEAKFLGVYDDYGVAEQTLAMYGTTTGADLNFVYLLFPRNGDGI